MIAPRLILFCVVSLALGTLAACARPTAEVPPSPEVVLATTTSVQDSGLLEQLIPRFEEQTGYQLKPLSVGSGAALELGARGEADVVWVHAPEAERAWLAEGNGTGRHLVMHNDFVIVGPPDDPAAVRGLEVVPALQQIAAQEATWVSRDDGSGTAQLEQQLWEAADRSPGDAAWYLRSGQGMGATLMLADERQAYTLSDRGTYLARSDSLALEVLVEGDPLLLNPYHIMPVNPDKFPEQPINEAGAQAFVEFLLSDEVQALIGELGVAEYGRPLFVPDGGKQESDLRP